ncbi:MAG: InlB B-repeat-containing protein, partial [Candidatus Pelethousia sp.]|nr:InlB B-repeat-containing protein [Candidatus Pelethousia sp.]
TVTFNSNGGSDVASITGLTSGATITKPADPILGGHTFEGWYRNQNLTGKWDFANDTVTESITLYAKWKLNPGTCIVTFDSKGGSAVAKQFITIGGKVQKPADPTLDGYTFEGWYYKEHGLEFVWKFDSYRVWQSFTLYAKWKPIPVSTYTVTFNSNGGSDVASITGLTSGATITKPADPALEGHTFEGWYRNQNLTGKWDFANDTVTESITLYAKWETVSTFTVTFDSKGGSSVPSISVNKGGLVTKPTNPWKSGYSFGGWYKDTSFTDDWDFNNDTISGNTTLYARWYYSYTPPYYYGGYYDSWNNYVYPYQLGIPKTGGMASLLPYVLLSASALCAAIAIKRKRDS